MAESKDDGMPMIFIKTRGMDGWTRDYSDYNLDELWILRGDATHVMLFWTGRRWLVEMTWRGEPLPPEPPMVFSDPDSGPVLKRKNWEIVGMPPRFDDVEPGYRPTRLISSVAFKEARAAVRAHSQCGPDTTILAVIDDPTLS